MRTALALCVLLAITAAAHAQQKIIDLGVAAEGLTEWVEVRFRFRTDGSGPGFGVALCDAARYADALPAIDDWSEPDAPGVFAIAFDTHNPPPTDEARGTDGERPPMAWFDERGNYYDRPQRELSVHEGDRERLNTLSPYDYTSGDWIDATLRVRYKPGAALVTLILDGEAVLRETPLPGASPTPSRVAIGGPEGFINEHVEVTDGAVRTGPAIEPFPAPVRVTVFDRRFVHAGDQRPRTIADFGGVPDSVARVVATLTLGEPETGYDHWDKKGRIALRVPGEEGIDVYEVLRFITPFRRGWTWRADVTDLLPLFEGRREFETWIETYMKGWLVSFTLDFYPGTPGRTPIEVVTLWDGSPEIGNPDNPPAEFFTPRTVDVPAGATHAVVRTPATGHGMAPNTDNAGEFMPLRRTLTVASESGEITATDRLWKTDVYLNPCRPQGGTWKFDRAGWAPGDLVPAWREDVSTLLEPGGALTVAYELEDYLNEGRGQTWAPHHWTTIQLVFFRSGDDREE